MNDGIEAEVLSILHVVGEHFDHLFQLELPGPAELQQKVVSVPWVVGDVIARYPFFHLVQNFLLFCGEVI